MTRIAAKSTESALGSASEVSPVPSATDVTTAPVSLPSPNLRHESVLIRELTTRLSQFDTALEVVVAEKEGKILRYEQESAERSDKHSLEIAELDRQAEDINKGRNRLKRALTEETNDE